MKLDTKKKITLIAFLLIITIFFFFLFHHLKSTDIPKDYKNTIKIYFSIDFANAVFSFSKPIKGYRRKGLAYGGEIVWEGWMVEVNITKKSRTGRLYITQPYLFFFKENQVIDSMLGNKHKLITKLK